MKTLITLTEEQQDLLRQFGDVTVTGPEEEFFHMPYWFKKTKEENKFEVLFPFGLPEYIKKSILDEINFGREFDIPKHIKTSGWT